MSGTTGTPARSRTSRKAAQFTESVIREMTRLALAHGAVNLSQGFPDFPAPPHLKSAAVDAIDGDVNQYAITWGARDLRHAIAADWAARVGVPIDPDRQVTVCCGSTEAMIATLLAIVDPGDEVIVFEPFYENYGPDAILSGATPRFVRLHPPVTAGATWTFDPDELRAAFSRRTRAIIINTPNNPTGKVFTRAELEVIAALAREWDVTVVTDEIYDHIVYDDAVHVPMASLEGMADRTVTINSVSKTFSVTGWRVGWAVAPVEIAGAIRKVHDFLTVGAAAPLQHAVVTALGYPKIYYEGLAAEYANQRDILCGCLDQVGLRYTRPEGAYFVMVDISQWGFASDVEFAHWMTREVGVAPVPGSSFFPYPENRYIRLNFAKRPATLREAGKRLLKLKRG